MRQFDQIVQKLRQHFDTVTLHPPAGEAALYELRERISAVPDVLLSFWRYCDGIRVTRYEEGDLFGIQRALSSYPLCGEDERLGRFVPFREDGCGDYDCVVVGDGPCEGAVVFWDHEIDDGAAYLLGGSLLGYLEMWADHMVHEYLPNGDRDPRCRAPKLDQWPWLGTPEYEHPWPFDEQWMRERDPVADRLLGDESSRRWLLRQDDLAET
jgi:hypothetical protein